MAKQTTILPKASVARILMNAGAKRVSQEAVDEFTDVLEKICIEIGEKAAKIAEHAGRRTVQDGDIKLAVK